MKHPVLIMLMLLAFSGCSGRNLTTPEGNIAEYLNKIQSIESNQWIWGNYTVYISPDRGEAEFAPKRNVAWHMNVTPFVEGPPCPNCLQVGKPHLLPDGTLKLKISLRHPFFGHPEYTGFDVRGICMFRATDKLEDDGFFISASDGKFLMEPVPVNYSDPMKGGATILNADGYTFYLNPILKMSWIDTPLNDMLPIFNYSKAKHAYGDNVDTTINPYKLFADTSPRRMFKHNDLFTRTYHIKPPEGSGSFEFGYVVSACWAPPIKTPVTNPETDFSVYANCEDAYNISIIQLTTITEQSYDNKEPTFKVTFNHRVDLFPQVVYIISSHFLKSNSTGNYPMRWFFKTRNKDDMYSIDAETTEAILRPNKDFANQYYDLIPGWHLGILGIIGPVQSYIPGTQFATPYSVQPVMMYVQE